MGFCVGIVDIVTYTPQPGKAEFHKVDMKLKIREVKEYGSDKFGRIYQAANCKVTQPAVKKYVVCH